MHKLFLLTLELLCIKGLYHVQGTSNFGTNLNCVSIIIFLLKESILCNGDPMAMNFEDT